MAESMSQARSNGSAPEGAPQNAASAVLLQEESRARELALRYRLEYVDLRTCEVDYHVVHELPVELMVRHSFVPLKRTEDTLFIAMADPTDLEGIDELEAQLHIAQLGLRLRISVATKSEVEEALKRGDTAAQIQQDATAAVRTDRLAVDLETQHGGDDRDPERLTPHNDVSPIINLVA